MSSFCPRALRLAVPLILLASVTAQWRNLPATLTPATPLTGITLSATSAGGLLLVGAPGNNEWRWTGTHWAITNAVFPRRSFHAAATDPRNGDVVLFGGLDGTSTPLLDTWRFRTTFWQPVNTASTPPVLQQMSMAFDAATDSMVLIGKNALNLIETWRLDSDWSLVTTASLPMSTLDVELYSDSLRGVAGAFVKTATGMSVYELEGGMWTSRASLPATTGDGTASFDALRGSAVYFEISPGLLGSTFEDHGVSLTRFAVTGPGSAPGIAMAYDADRSETVLVTAGSQFETWGYAPQPAPFATPYGAGCNNTAFRLGLAPGDVPSIGTAHRIVAQSAPGATSFVIFGLSHTFDNGPLPRPIPGTTCLQRVQALSVSLLLSTPPTFQITVPNSQALLGVRYDTQMVGVGQGTMLHSTNGLEVQIGSPPLEYALIETFVTDAARDATVSGDEWGNGVVTPVELGGTGRHGSFDPSHGTVNGPFAWIWDTDNQVIPASATLSGDPETVTDGRFYFTDFTLPANYTIDFRGSAPVQIFVRGEVDIAGRLRCNGAAMTTFNARGATTQPTPYVSGQPGGMPGPGGGYGGRGGDECRGTGPIIVAGEVLTDGANGDDVRVSAGHAYAANVVGTGGKGSALNPPTGIAAPNTPLVGFVYRAYFAPGGSGGGFSGAGGTSTVTPLTNQQIGPAPAGGGVFGLLPIASSSSLEHFTIGGSGGGGGGSHAFGTIYVAGDVYLAGAAGSGGGGALAIRSGGFMDFAQTAVLEAKGGAGALINGRDANGPGLNVNWGISSPGGGGSGGSFLLQTSSDLRMRGSIDTSGGDGSSTGGIATSSLNVQSQAGAGSPGFFRLEAAGINSLQGLTIPSPTAANFGPLTDTDDRTGSRSIWLRPGTLALPIYVRYELVADINGSSVIYSDDPAVSALAADDPNGAVYVRFQGARVDSGTGAVLPATTGPWRAHVAGPGSLNTDRAQALRFDLVLDKSVGTVAVREVRVIWR